MSQTEIKIDHHRKKNREGVEYKDTISYQFIIELGGVSLTSAWFDDTWENIQKRADQIREAIISNRITVITNQLK